MSQQDDESTGLRPDPNSPIVYMALSILCASQKQNSLIPELLYILSPKQIMNFISVFGGESVYVPTTQEFSRDLMAATCCYHILVENKSWDWVALNYHADGNIIRILKNKVEGWWNNLSPGEKDFITSLRDHEDARAKQEVEAEDIKV
jgi:hypothetical protein